MNNDDLNLKNFYKLFHENVMRGLLFVQTINAQSINLIVNVYYTYLCDNVQYI